MSIYLQEDDKVFKCSQLISFKDFEAIWSALNTWYPNNPDVITFLNKSLDSGYKSDISLTVGNCTYTIRDIDNEMQSV